MSSLLDAIDSGLVVRIGSDITGFTAGMLGVQTQFDELNMELGTNEQEFNNWGLTITENAVAIGLAISGVGVSIVGLSESAMKTNADLGSTALTMGVTTEELRNLAIETANADFTLTEVTKTFDLLSKAGVKSTSDLTTIAGSMDDLADATGNTADATTAIMIPALNAFNIPLIDAAEHTDSLTYMVKNSQISLDDFSMAMKRMAPAIDESGLSMDQVITYLMTLESRGITGKAAITELNKGFAEMQVATAAGKDPIVALNEALGINTTELAKNEVNSANLTGTTKKYMDVANSGIGTTTALSVEFEKFTLAAGTLLTPLDGLGAVLVASGPLMMGMAGLPALIDLVNVSMLFLAANPIVLVVAAIVGLVAVIVILETEFGVVSACADALGVAWQWLSDNVIAPFIGWLTEATAGIDVIGIAFTVLLGPIGLVSVAMQALGIDWEDVWNAITWAAQESADIITGIIEALMTGIEWAFDLTIGTVSSLWQGFWDDVSWVTESASDIITGIVEGLTDAITWAFDNLISPLQDAWDQLWGGMEDTISATSDFIMGIVDGITGSITGMINIAIDSINSMIEGVNALSFDIPDLFGGPPTHIGFSIPPIPRLASGGIVTSPTLAMIGEAGPEAVIPLSGGGTGAMGGVTITGNTFNVRNDGDIKAIAQELQTLITRTNRGRGIS